MDSKRGFTLIELLIVVAIIAILAAIAVPNLLEAQMRAKVTRTVSDMRTIGVGMGAYQVDNNCIPYFKPSTTQALPWLAADRSTFVDYVYVGGDRDPHVGNMLTSPVAYLSSIPVDYFNTKTKLAEPYKKQGKDWSAIYSAMTKEAKVNIWTNWQSTGTPGLGMVAYYWRWNLESAGPDNRWWYTADGAFYDPTNGTISAGDIWYFEGSRTFPTK